MEREICLNCERPDAVSYFCKFSEFENFEIEHLLAQGEEEYVDTFFSLKVNVIKTKQEIIYCKDKKQADELFFKDMTFDALPRPWKGSVQASEEYFKKLKEKFDRDGYRWTYICRKFLES